MKGSSKDAKKKPWYLDIGYSRHMTGDKQWFNSFIKKEGGLATFENNDKGQIKAKGIRAKKDSVKIDDVQYIEGLKLNLLSIHQLYDSGFEVIFKPNIC